MFAYLIAIVWGSSTLPHTKWELNKCVLNNWMNEKNGFWEKIQAADMIEELHLICNLCIRVLLAMAKK